MTEITLVRHGQASFGSDNYDQLSPLGFQQAEWLGEYFAERDLHFDRVIIGKQLRHQQTAESIVKALAHKPELETHSGFNEYNFHALYDRFCQQYPDQIDTGYQDRRHFYVILRKAIMAWSQDQLTGSPPESWQEFDRRIEAAMKFAIHSTHDKPKQKVLVVSSGGAISMILKQTLDLSAEHMVRLNLQVINSSFSRLLNSRNGTHMLSFNNVTHLDHPSRLDSITYS